MLQNFTPNMTYSTLPHCYRSQITNFISYRHVGCKLQVKGTAWWAVQLDSGIVAFTLRYISGISMPGKICKALHFALMGGGGAEIGI
jgi:hypothetical protein